MAYCGKCGKYVPNDVFKCPNCGAILRRGAKKSVIPLLKQIGWSLVILGMLALVSWFITSCQLGSS